MRGTQGISALDAAEPYDVCIIGSGFTGTIVGMELTRAGARTLLLESGASLARWFTDRRVRDLAAYEVSGDTGYPTTRTKARALGGNSNFWTGRCSRFQPSDFGEHPFTPRENPWPFSYKELEPWYERAEHTLRVRGGPLSEHMPPRRTPLPLPARSDISDLKELCARAGVVVDDSPTATPRKALRFFRVEHELMPDFLALPNAVAVAGATVTRLLVDRDRRVIGAEARTLDGTVKVARAKIYVVACGGIETPRLLLLSRSETFPNGVGNGHDRVGRGFNEHPNVNLYGKFRHSRATLAPRHKVGRCHQFYEEFRKAGLGAVDISVVQSWLFPNHLMPPVELLRDFVRATGRVARPTLYFGPTIEMRPRDENRVTLAPHAKDRFGNPLAHLIFNFAPEDRRTLAAARELALRVFRKLGIEDIREGEVTWSRHHIGTCRMGTNPKTSVVDQHQRVHECPNLYLGGSEVFVTGAAVQPVLTITALALRLAETLKLRLQGQDVQSASVRRLSA